jgi:subtilisin family serine protease
MLGGVLRGVTAVLAAGAFTVLSAAGASAGQASSIPSGALDQLIANIQKAQTLSTGSGITVAVVSTGVDPSEGGLEGRVTTGPDYAFAPTVPLSNEYGTVAASIIAGSGPTGSQPLTALGVAPDARILSIRAYPQDNESGASAFENRSDYENLNAESIDYAVKHGAQVVYVDSGSTDTPTQQLRSAVAAAIAKKVIIVVPEESYQSQRAAYTYPAGMPGVIGVASTRLAGGTAPYDKDTSSQNNAIVLAGPGNTFIDTDGWGIDGPGAAGAIVAGTVALMKSLYPGLTAAQAERALASSASYHPSGGYNTTIGFGLVDPYTALQAASTLVKETSSPAGVGSGSRLATGPVPGIIKAVHHSEAKLISYIAAIVVGVLLLLGALLLLVRGRYRPGLA